MMGSTNSALSASVGVETDSTVQAFAQWLTEMKARSSRTLQQMLSEMSIIRDGITSNNMELTDFKRNSTGISQQMQTQLTDLREKLTNAFGEITQLVKQKTQSDQEMMQDINSLQGNLSMKSAELESLKRSYSQAHQQLQSSLIQITNHLSVTKSEVVTATASCERVQGETGQRLGDIDSNLRGLEDMLSVGNAENRNQMLQLQEEIARIHESLASVSSNFLDHKRAINSVHNKLQSQVWEIDEARKRQEKQAEEMQARVVKVKPEATYAATRPASYEPEPVTASATVVTPYNVSGGLAATGPAQSSSSITAAPEIAGTTYRMPGMQQAGLQTQRLQPAGAQQVELITFRGKSVPHYMEHHLRALPVVKLREHAMMLYHTMGHEVIGSPVPVHDHELIEWVTRLHRVHLEPLRVTQVKAAPTRSTGVLGETTAVLPTQPQVVGTQQMTAVIPGVQSRTSVVMARPTAAPTMIIR